MIFLLVASYHFGKEDTVFNLNIEGIEKDVLFLLKGSSIILAPLLFNYDKTNEIFLILKFTSPVIAILILFPKYFSKGPWYANSKAGEFILLPTSLFDNK